MSAATGRFVAELRAHTERGDLTACLAAVTRLAEQLDSTPGPASAIDSETAHALAALVVDTPPPADGFDDPTRAQLRARALRALERLASDDQATRAVIGAAVAALVSDRDAAVLRASCRAAAACSRDMVAVAEAVVDAGALPHCLFLVRNALDAAVVRAATDVAAQWCWLLHARLAIEGKDPDFPVVPRTEVAETVAHAAALLSGTARPAIDWETATSLVRWLGTVASINNAWRALLDPHTTALLRWAAVVWPSAAKDPRLADLCGYTARLLAKVDAVSLVPCLRAMYRADPASLLPLAECARDENHDHLLTALRTISA